MADICMCSGKDCPVKEKCYRFTSLVNEYGQSYFLEPPGKIEEGKFTCDVYWGENTEGIWHQLKDITTD